MRRVFNIDREFEQRVRESILVPVYYPNYMAENGQFVHADGEWQVAKFLQLAGADAVFRNKRGDMISVEEKAVRWIGRPYTAYSFETDSCTTPGRERDGWMHYSGADVLVYTFVQRDRFCIHRMPFKPVLDLFWRFYEKFPTFGPHKDPPHAAGRVVPFKFLEAHGIRIDRTELFPDREGEFFAYLFPELAAEIAAAAEGGNVVSLRPAGRQIAEAR